MKTLKEIKIGQSAVIKALHSQGALRHRMMDMGITAGTEISVKRTTPLGDPVLVTVQGYDLLLRKTDMKLIEVE